MSNRRDFILQTCALCASAVGLGILANLESCKPAEGLTVSKTQITIPVKFFSDKKNYLIKDILLPFDVLVVKHPDETYAALQLMCTHRSYPLRITPDELVCDNHGSKFDYDGAVVKGPASMPLRKYPATVENGRIVVKLNA